MIDQLIDEEIERAAFIERVIQRLLNEDHSGSISDESGPGRVRVVSDTNVEQAEGSKPQDRDTRRRQEQ